MRAWWRRFLCGLGRHDHALDSVYTGYVKWRCRVCGRPAYGRLQEEE